MSAVEDRIRPDHPLHDIKRRTERLLAALTPQFAKAYSHTGRPSVPPERLLKTLLQMALDSSMNRIVSSLLGLPRCRSAIR